MKASFAIFVIGALVVGSGLVKGQGEPPASALTSASAAEIRKLGAMKMIWADGDGVKPGSPARRQFRDEFLARSALFLASYPNHPDLWILRAEAALELGYSREGWEAGRKLLALGMETSADPGVQLVLVQLERRNWLADEAPPAPVPSPREESPAAADSPPPPSESHWAGGPRPPPSGLRLAEGPAPPAEWAGKAIAAGETGIQMEWIPSGSFQRGDDRTGPVSTVHITRGFWLGKYDVTQGQWEAMMGGNPSHFQDQGKNAPVEMISWKDAAGFCRKLSEQEKALGRLPMGYEYRLPTEAEWEYACRAGTSGDFGGDGVLNDMGWYSDNSGDHPHPVGQKAPNAWGLYDMHGNVSEWCLDWYGPYSSAEVTDPAGSASGSRRVDRGGRADYSADECRSAYRSKNEPSFRNFALGFRLALSPVQ